MKSPAPLKPLLLAGLASWVTAPLIAQEPPTDFEEPAPLTADPARDIFEAAQLAYSEGRNAKNGKAAETAYQNAQRTFERFLKAFPYDRRVPEAQFYIASCYEKLSNPDAALSAFIGLAKSGASGPLPEAAAQQVAATYYKNKKYEAAEPFFARLAKLTTKPETRHLALFQRALCLQNLERTDDLKKALRDVVFDEGSPYQEKARSAIAGLYVKTGEKDRAYANYQILAKSSDRAIASDAVLQAALLARELGKDSDATEWFALVMRTPELSKWHGKAQLTLMSEAYAKKDYAATVALYERGKYKLPRDQDAQRIAMTAESHRLLGNQDAANRLYAILAKVSPDKDQSFEAGYAVLTRQYEANDAGFLKAGHDFLNRHEKGHPGDGRLDNVHLMLAEKYFGAKKFREAAQQYNSVNLTRINPASVSGLRYRLAYSRMKEGNKQGARDSFNVFLAKHPQDALAVRALAHRASIQLSLGAKDAALADYEQILGKSQDSDLRLQALSGMAELYRQKENFPKLIETHTQLLKGFPSRPRREQAASHFILGWSHFKQEQPDKAMPEFTRARELNPSGLGKDATIHLALIHFARQDEGALKPELDRLLKEFPDSGLPRPVYAWLGAKRAADEDYEEAWKYLNKATTLSKPTETKTAVWKAYAKTAEALGKHQETLLATDILIPQEESPYLRALLLHRKSKALLGLRKYSAATEIGKQALELKPQGELNAELRITLGDIERTQNKLDEALVHYVVVAELIGTGDTREAAIRRSIEAYREKGDSTSLAASARYEAMLKQ